MAPRCPSCQSENDEAAEVCFHCRAVLAAVTRGSRVGGRYRVEATLGRGGMGAVYRARDEVLDEEVALKILRPEVAGTPEMAARFRSEIKLARRVSHGNVCRIHEYGEDGTLQYISMELIAGATLKDRLRAGPLPADEAYDVAAQVADGLAAIHKAGIVHRDLKSANVMIDGAGTAKVMDFGIAKPAPTGPDPSPSTGYVLGSPEYMSPEQARGRRADFRSDIYSLGIVVFEAFTGRVPFRGSTPVETLMMHVESTPPVADPSLGLPPPLLPVLATALAKRPEDRFADAAAMAAALRAARAGLPAPPVAPWTDATQRLADPERRPRRAVIAAAALAAGGLAAAMVLATRDRDVPSLTAPASASPLAEMTGASPSPLPSPMNVEASPSARAVMPSPSMAARASALGPPDAPSPPAAPAPAPTSASVAPPPTTVAAAAVPTPAPPPSAAPSPAAPSPATPAEGWLLILVTPWADVTVDGRVVGTTPLAQFPLTPGAHAVVLTNPRYRPFTRRVTIVAGETTRFRFNFEEEGVRR